MLLYKKRTFRLNTMLLYFEINSSEDQTDKNIKSKTNASIHFRPSVSSRLGLSLKLPPWPLH